MRDFVLSALLNAVVLAGVPLLGYLAYHKVRHDRAAKEVLERAGLVLGEARYIGFCAVFSAVVVTALALWQPPLDELTAEGSAWREFLGVGLGAKGITMALVYGVVKTGFPEEFLFRGLIAGSLSRRLSLVWANLWQALVFLLPHGLVVLVMPRLWPLLIAIFAGALFVGWARIRSGSILGPWLAHACLNVATGLSVLARSAPGP